MKTLDPFDQEVYDLLGDLCFDEIDCGQSLHGSTLICHEGAHILTMYSMLIASMIAIASNII